MALYPRYGRGEDVNALANRPQVQETLTRLDQPRLDRFLFREMGMFTRRNPRGVPTAYPIGSPPASPGTERLEDRAGSEHEG